MGFEVTGSFLVVFFSGVDLGFDSVFVGFHLFLCLLMSLLVGPGAGVWFQNLAMAQKMAALLVGPRCFYMVPFTNRNMFPPCLENGVDTCLVLVVVVGLSSLCLMLGT